MISGAGLCWQHIGGVGSTTTTTTTMTSMKMIILIYLLCPDLQSNALDCAAL